MTSLDYYDPLYHSLPYWHKSTGLLVMFLLLIRLAWRRVNIKPDALKTYKNHEIVLASFIQDTFYIVILFIGLTGYLISTSEGKGIKITNGLEVPAIVRSIDEDTVDLIGEMHLMMAILLSSLVVFHALAALKHHFIDQDNTLKRMLGI